MDAERLRLAEARTGVPWKRWGPYLSERQWGTVREDYSADGNAWEYFSHDQARSRSYRWGEDGIAGICDDSQRLCLALAFWNGRDPILKERLFGLTNAEGNHGEDVKEYYFYLDATPTSSYLKQLYKYPQAAYPYADLVATNRARGRQEPEYELIDTGAFDGDRYFDVLVEYAKDGPEELLLRVTATNRGPDPAELHVLPTLWFRNTWAWHADEPRPMLRRLDAIEPAIVHASHAELGERWLVCAGAPAVLVTENESNNARLFGGENPTRYVKDGVNEAVVHGRGDAVDPSGTGTKAAAHYLLQLPGGDAATLRLRLTDADPAGRDRAALVGASFDAAIEARRAEADAFYAPIAHPGASEDERRVLRQALAGMLWSKQVYGFDLDRWLTEHDANPLRRGTRVVRNREWVHMANEDVISMPDTWEYPWYAAWDLAFHAVALDMVDTDFARTQLELMLQPLYLHPNGQIPAYEWNFGDVNPPVHAWAVRFLHVMGAARGEPLEHEFLQRTFQKLLLNFTWWVNRKDVNGQNVFQGGFLGLDNIGVFDRSAALPTGGSLEQADGTAWMAFYCQSMLQLALELADRDPTFEEMATKFLEHFLWIAGAMDRVGVQGDELWDDEDGFFYDVLRLPDGSATRLKVRSLVGLLPLCASTVVERDTLERFPGFAERATRFVRRHPELTANIAPLGAPGVNGRRLLALVNEDKLRRILARMLDEERFLSPYGIRSLSRWHLEHPYVFRLGEQEFRVQYLPAESDSGLFGGNSNWRGPIWFPINALLVRSLLQLYLYYGDAFRVECPTGSGVELTLFEVAIELCRRLTAIFLRDERGRRAVFGGTERFQTDPYWRDNLLFYEYFNGDDGAGLGASHQTGWTGLVARLMTLQGLDPAAFLAEGAIGAPAGVTG